MAYDENADDQWPDRFRDYLRVLSAMQLDQRLDRTPAAGLLKRGMRQLRTLLNE